MTSSSPSPEPSLQEALANLRYASMIHGVAWVNYANPQNRAQAERDGGAASALALKNIPVIYDAYLGARESAIRDGMFSGSELESFLNTPFGLLVTPATRTEQNSNKVSLSTRGQARLPPRGTPYPSAPLDRVLNMMKHRYRPDKEWMNFRADAGRHILVICGPGMGRRPDYIFEFDVLAFCDLCDQGTGLI